MQFLSFRVVAGIAGQAFQEGSRTGDRVTSLLILVAIFPFLIGLLFIDICILVPATLIGLIFSRDKQPPK